jgi:hypothetical protein
MSVQRDSRIDSLGNDQRSVLVLKEILRDYNKEVLRINETLGIINERIAPPTGGTGAPGASPAPPNFDGQVQLLSIFLFWSASEPSAHMYEIRRSPVLNWDIASFVTRTPSLTVNLPPLLAGTYYFMIKSIDALGNYSSGYSSVNLTVGNPLAPTVTATVIDNNVLLYWSIPKSSHQISYYNLYKDDVLFGIDRGTFTPIFETISGTYTYSVEPVDIAGNIGGRGSVTTIVNQPPDFELEDQRVTDLYGTRVNVARLPDPYTASTPTLKASLLACTNIVKTWEEHFTSRSWTTIEEQINAGYPIYAQPTELTGSYEEVIDYLTEISNTIATINYQFVEHVAQVGLVIKLAWSTDNVTFTPFTIGNSQFIPLFRYLKMRLEFTCDTDKALGEFSMIQITLDVKKEMDSGYIIANKDDLDGTWVAFTKQFKDIDSITATADSIEPIDVIYNYVDVPDPEGFYIFALDTTGNRVTYLVTWKARGIA